MGGTGKMRRKNKILRMVMAETVLENGATGWRSNRISCSRRAFPSMKWRALRIVAFTQCILKGFNSELNVIPTPFDHLATHFWE